jgi:hypothetical protein
LMNKPFGSLVGQNRMIQSTRKVEPNFLCD